MRVLVTGHTGTLGTALTALLLEDGHSVIGYSRDELKQSQWAFKNQTIQYLGDVRDERRIVEASRGCELIFHLAALKHIDKLEECPEEAIQTNEMGTRNVLYAQRVNKVNRVVLSSTDKACLPISAYGASKLMAERLVMRDPNNTVCRYGNVISSRGSVIPNFIKSIKEDNIVRITDKRMTRFWIKPEQAAVFVYLESQKTMGGLKIPSMKAYPVLPLAMLVGKILGKKPGIEEVGIRGREKLHEDLRQEDEGGRINSGDRENWYSEKEMYSILEEIVKDE